jgi:ketosteroid isomerase-like protein
MSRENIELVKQFVMGGAGDYPDDLVMAHEDNILKVPDRDARLEKLRETLHPDIVVHIPASMPYGGDHVGLDGVLAMSDAMNATWNIPGGLDMSFVEFGDDHVVCIVQWLGESVHTGQTIPMRMAEFFRVADGKIIEITPFYWDTAAVVEATGGARTITVDRYEEPTLRRPLVKA